MIKKNKIYNDSDNGIYHDYNIGIRQVGTQIAWYLESLCLLIYLFILYGNKLPFEIVFLVAVTGTYLENNIISGIFTGVIQGYWIQKKKKERKEKKVNSDNQYCSVFKCNKYGNYTRKRDIVLLQVFKWRGINTTECVGDKDYNARPN